MDTPSRGYIMVVNDNGDRKKVKVSDYNQKHNLNESSNELQGYTYDLEWDLSHGFTEANKAFYDIENGNIK